jgi:DNA primase
MTDIAAIKSAVNIAKLVERHHPLTGSGRYLKAKEHDSLVIDTTNGHYHWNSRAESGDIIDWIGRHELSYNGTWNSADPALFKEAVTWLSQYAGIEPPQFRPEDPAQRAERLTAERLMALAADYYRANMARHIQPYQYAVSRHLSQETIDKYLGYADGRL